MHFYARTSPRRARNNREGRGGGGDLVRVNKREKQMEDNKRTLSFVKFFIFLFSDNLRTLVPYLKHVNA